MVFFRSFAWTEWRISAYYLDVFLSIRRFMMSSDPRLFHRLTGFEIISSVWSSLTLLIPLYFKDICEHRSLAGLEGLLRGCQPNGFWHAAPQVELGYINKHGEGALTAELTKLRVAVLQYISSLLRFKILKRLRGRFLLELGACSSTSIKCRAGLEFFALYKPPWCIQSALIFI